MDVNGSITVFPAITTTYTITATGQGGTATENITVTVNPITLTITSPSNGDIITKSNILVKGTITSGNETGIAVNGKPAMAFGGEFAVNHVPLQAGENIITATAVDTAGNTVEVSITVNAQPNDDYVWVTAMTESGVSPLETVVDVEGSFSFNDPIFTSSGLGQIKYLDITENYEYNVRMTGPGLYYFTAQVEDGHGSTYSDTIAILVMEEAAMDALLKAKWDAVKTALINRDLEGALACFAMGSRDNYEQIFSSLTEGKLQGIASGMRKIEKIYIKKNRAKYGINREETVQGVVHDITYIIYFVKDGNGLWKLESF